MSYMVNNISSDESVLKHQGPFKIFKTGDSIEGALPTQTIEYGVTNVPGEVEVYGRTIL